MFLVSMVLSSFLIRMATVLGRPKGNTNRVDHVCLSIWRYGPFMTMTLISKWAWLSGLAANFLIGSNYALLSSSMTAFAHLGHAYDLIRVGPLEFMYKGILLILQSGCHQFDVILIKALVVRGSTWAEYSD